MTESKGRFADRRRVHQRQEAGRVGHHQRVKESLVVIEHLIEKDVSFEISRLGVELQSDALKLELERFDAVRQKAHQPKLFAFGLGEGGRLIQPGIVKNSFAALAFHGRPHLKTSLVRLLMSLV